MLSASSLAKQQEMPHCGGMKYLHSIFCAGLLLSAAAQAGDAHLSAPDDADPETPAALRHSALVDERFALHQEKQADDPDWFVRRGVRAHRGERVVEIDAEATGLSPEHPVEFILIGTASGHDYEALAISFAAPSDVHAALKWIGLPAGKAVQTAARRFFPKGERVHVSFEWTDEEERLHQWPAESLIMDARIPDSLLHEGFTFVGSQWVEAETGRRYAADVRDPHSIISIYNEPATVLDRPRVVSQGAVYGFLHPYPDRQPAVGQFLRITLRPEKEPGDRRVFDTVLSMAPDERGATVLSLRNGMAEALHEGRTLSNVLHALNRLVSEGRTPYVQLEYDPEIALDEIRSVLKALKVLEEEDLLYMEPPLGDDLFYRAFLPVEDHRDRARRPSQALELTLRSEEDAWTGVLAVIEDTRSHFEAPFEAEVSEYPVDTPEALREAVDKIGHPLPVLLLFVSGAASYGDIMEWLHPVMDTHPLIHVFTQ